VTPNGPSYRALPRLYKAVGLWWVQGKALVAESILSGLYPYEPTKGHRPLETVNPAILLTRHTRASPARRPPCPMASMK